MRPIRDHPRAGGENVIPRNVAKGVPGSSPRGRGKRGIEPHSLGLNRIIPARAGKTSLKGSGTPALWDHPRAGGENAGVVGVGSGVGGSSPRGRGKHCLSPSLSCRGRIIPARAGKTGLAPATQADGGDHPRAGGENCLLGCGEGPGPGSSPRGRGKLSSSFRLVRCGRIIPARAGKTPPSWRSRPSARDHPRAGGENDTTRRVSAGTSGSSPRGRGKPAQTTTARRSQGIIPARAGKTSARHALST